MSFNSNTYGKQALPALPYNGTEPQEAPAAQDTASPTVSENTVSTVQTVSTGTTDSAVPQTTEVQDAAEGVTSPEAPSPDHDITDIGHQATSTVTEPIAAVCISEPPAAALTSLPHASDRPSRGLPFMNGNDSLTRFYNYLVPYSELYYNDQKQYFLKYDNIVSGCALLYSDEMDSLIDKIRTMELNELSEHGISNTISATLEALSGKYGEQKCFINRSLLLNKTEFYYCLSANRILVIKDGTISEYMGGDIIPCNNSTFLNQIEPDQSSRAEDLPKLIRICFNVDDEYADLFTVHLIALFLQNKVVKIPILLLTGDHGTAKTTALSQIQQLVDPRTVNCISLPSTKDDLAVSLYNSDFLTLDNISAISTDYSNLLCQAITGGSYTKRVLYTTCKMVSLPLKTNLAFTSITNPFEKSDLAERTDIIPMKPILSYVSENDRDDLFKANKAKLLGSIFDTLRVGLPMYHEMKQELQGNLPRMADYVIYGAAFTKAMGISPDKFLDAYKSMTHEIVSECADDFTLLVSRFAKQNNGWEGTATELDQNLKALASMEHPYSIRSASSLSRNLSGHISDLKCLGVTVDIKHSTPKCITLTYSGGGVV